MPIIISMEIVHCSFTSDVRRIKMKLNPVETMPLDTLIGVYGTVLNEYNLREENVNFEQNMGQHFCFGYARQIYYRKLWKKKYKIYPRKKKYTHRRKDFIDFCVVPTYFYPLNVVNIVGWFPAPSI